MGRLDVEGDENFVTDNHVTGPRAGIGIKGHRNSVNRNSLYKPPESKPHQGKLGVFLIGLGVTVAGGIILWFFGMN